ncbi:MAG: hypothetical protein QG608_2990 [Actinomycetota bacterium]|nr:hypothetical protein [Actinomycetota bacterium]
MAARCTADHGHGDRHPVDASPVSIVVFKLAKTVAETVCMTVPIRRRASSIPPGISCTSHRPRVLCLWPVPAVLLVVASLLLFVWSLWQDSTVTPDSEALLLSAAVLVLSLSHSRRMKEHERLCDALARANTAWENLKATSGISVIETNIRVSREHAGSRKGRRRRRRKKFLAETDRIEKQLRTIRPISYPTTPPHLKDRLRSRYEEVSRLNRELISEALKHDDDIPRRARSEVSVKLRESKARWDASISDLRLTVARSQPLEELIDRTDMLVKYWWGYVVNDPAYWETESDLRKERRNAYKNARDALSCLTDAVRHRDLGYRWWKRLFVLLTSTTEERRSRDCHNMRIEHSQLCPTE